MKYIQLGRAKLALPIIKSTPKDKWVKMHVKQLGLDKNSLENIWDDVNGIERTEKTSPKDSSGTSSNNRSKRKKTRGDDSISESTATS